MRIRVQHRTTYRYDRPARAIQQVLRVTPRPHDGQQVLGWRLTADSDVRLRWVEDAFGNIAHNLSTERPTDTLCVTVAGEVVTSDTAGVVRGAVERLPCEAYLRTTPRTLADAAVLDLAHGADPGGDTVVRLHALMHAVAGRVAFVPGATTADTTAAQALAGGQGVCQDLAQVFIAAARTLGIPARYVSGHLMRPETPQQEAAHAWGEAHVAGLGWVGFDPANRICPTDAYVRVAVGLDSLDAVPVRGARSGGGTEAMTVALTVEPARQSQWQSQGQGWQSQGQ